MSSQSFMWSQMELSPKVAESKVGDAGFDSWWNARLKGSRGKGVSATLTEYPA